MRKNFRITVDGRSYDVVVEDVDQASEPAQLPGAAVAPAPVALAPAHASAPAPAPAPLAAPAAGGAGTIAAPIGGVVRSIDVAIGRVIAVGDKVATIEAMKMKTEVVSKIAGKVTNIDAQVNEPVETGQVLMTLA
jgi:glutaconyl-CoA/methylmalonyl-CoA decarboxylase subunit gamma